MAEIIAPIEDGEEDNMTDETTGPGAQLAKARELMGLSQEHIADRLKLMLSVLKQLELDDYPKEIPATFLRGYMRAYANIVNLNPDEIVTAFNKYMPGYEEKLLTNSSTTIDNKGQRFTRERRQYRRQDESSSGLLKGFLLLVAVCALAAYLYLFFLKDLLSGAEESATAKSIDSLSSESSEQDAKSEEATGSKNGATTTEPEDKPALEKTSAVASEPAAQTLPTSESVEAYQKDASPEPSGEKLLQMTFQDNCWIKVTDKEENVILLGLKKKGHSIAIDALPPLSVTLGNPGVVSMVFGDKSIDLGAHEAGRPVTFTIN